MPAQEQSTLNKNPQEKTKEVDLLTWTAPARPFKRKNREFYANLFAMAGIVGLVLFLVEGWMPVILIISIIFLYYVMNTVEPEKIEYRITNKGISVGGNTSVWDSLVRFWFAKRLDSELVVVETSTFPGRLEFVIDQEKKDKISEKLKDYIPEEKAPPSFLDKSSNWIGKKLD